MKPAAVVLRGLEAELSEEDQLVLLAKRDPRQFQKLYKFWVGRVYQFVYSRVGIRQDAEDITSQIFINAYQAFSRYRHQGTFSAWLFTIARNQLKGFYRNQAWKRNLPLEAADKETRLDSNADYFDSNEIERLDKLIRKLPNDLQELIQLRYVAELKFSEIAVILNRREDTVKKTLYRLQERLQKLLEEHHE